MLRLLKTTLLLLVTLIVVFYGTTFLLTWWNGDLEVKYCPSEIPADMEQNGVANV